MGVLLYYIGGFVFLELSLSFSWLSLSFSVVLLLVFSSVLVFSSGYSSAETNLRGFYSYVVVFVISMFILIFGTN